MLMGITEERDRIIGQLLQDLLVKAESEAVFLCDRGGYILNQTAVRDYDHHDNIAALAAGSFFATREIARLVGEPEFQSVLHQGDNKGIYMQNVNDLLIVVVYGPESNAGLTKLCAEETGRRLASCLEQDEKKEIASKLQEVQISGQGNADLFSDSSHEQNRQRQ